MQDENGYDDIDYFPWKNMSPEKYSRMIQMVAFHEAGHVLVARALGMRAKRVAVGNSGGGMTEIDNVCSLTPDEYDEDYLREVARQSIVMYYAGYQSQLAQFPTTSTLDYFEDDYAAILCISEEFGVMPKGCRKVGGRVHIRYLNELKDESCRLLEEHWTTVVSVATALIKNRKLSEDEIVDLCG